MTKPESKPGWLKPWKIRCWSDEVLRDGPLGPEKRSELKVCERGEICQKTITIIEFNSPPVSKVPFAITQH